VATVKPMVNQLEYHPQLAQKEMRGFCDEHEIQLEAWAPLTRGAFFDDPVIQELAEKYGKTPAQIVSRWDVQTGVSTIQTSVTPERIRPNIDRVDFEMTEGDTERLDTLDTHERLGKDPDNFSFDD